MLNTALVPLFKRVGVLALFACSLAQAQAPLQGARVAYVSTERLMTESKLAKSAESKLEAEFSKRQKVIGDQIAQIKTMSEKFAVDRPLLNDTESKRRERELYDLDNDLQRKQREFREDLNQRRNEERANIAQKAAKIIEQIAEQDKLDIVLQETVWVSPRIDITDKILKQLDK